MEVPIRIKKIDKSSLSGNIELMESWHKIFNNLDRHSPDDMEPLLSEYTTVNVNLASIHHDSRLRKKYLKIAEEYSGTLTISYKTLLVG